MITEITVSNYKSIGQGVRLTLRDLTALVGPNGSGKSNLADVFRFLAEALSVGLDSALTKRHGIHVVRRWSSGRPFNMSIEVKLKEAGFSGSYAFTLAGDRAEDYRVKEEEAVFMPNRGDPVRFRLEDGKWVDGPNDLRPKVTPRSLALTLVGGDERFAPITNALTNVCIYSIFPDTLREPQKPDSSRPMRQHGENWASTLKGLSGSDTRSDLTAVMGKLTGDINEYRVKPIGGFLSAEFRHQSRDNQIKHRQKWFESAQESDGTLRFAGIVTALLQTPPLTLIGVEEPELTVHVGAISLLYDYLKQASNRGQVLVTTHSVELLEKLDIEDIRVVARRDGVTSVGRVEEKQREAVKQRLLTVGDIVGMEGLKQEELPLQDSGRD
jgi:predicted ATPase